MKLEEFLAKEYNYNKEIKDNINSFIELWNSCYRGNIKDFHNYFIYNGKTKIKQKRYSLNLYKECSEDWSDIIWNEKCTISFEDDKSQEQFDELINDLDLYKIINQALEKSGGLGTSATVVGVYDLIENDDTMTIDVSSAKTRIDIVDVDWIYPLSWSNKGITECAFGSVEYHNGDKYIVCSVHLLNDKGNYIIKNHLFKSVNGNLTEITSNDTIKEFDTKSDIPWFSVWEPLLTNNLFKNNPFGIPYYANAIDVAKTCDLCFDALRVEIRDGRKRTFARADMFTFDNGEQKLVFDPNDTTIYQLPKGATKDDLIQTDSDKLRTQEQINSLNTALNIFGSKVGFGENHYHFDGTNLSTATAVVSSNSKLFRRKKKLEIGYESSIYDLVMAICYASTNFGTYDINTDGLKITFDDSITEDKEAESIRATREVTNGLISRVEYRMKIFGETEDIATKKIQEIDKDLKEQSDDDIDEEKEEK